MKIYQCDFLIVDAAIVIFLPPAYTASVRFTQKTSALVRTTLAVGTLFTMSISAAVAAPSAAELITTPDDSVVTRGDLIRAAVIALKLPQGKGTRTDLPYLRVPTALAPYIETAHDRKALTFFGTDLLLARGISRGDALRVLVALQELRGGSPVSYRDVNETSPYLEAVRIAVQRNWMSPVSPDSFGVTRMLTGKEARLLLRKVTGEAGGLPLPSVQENLPTNTVQTIQVNLSKRTGRPLPKTQIIETIWELLNNDYLYIDKVDPDEVAYNVAEAIARSAGDPYTSFLRPASSQSFQSQIGGEVSGIGAQVEMKDGILTIISPLRSSPAEKAGLLPGDQIIQADGVSLKDMDFLKAVEKVKGPKGSTVKLLIRRNAVELEFSVVRDTVKVPEIEITWQKDVAVVKLMQFGKLTDTELRTYMADVQKQNPRGLILDVRNNPGGLLHAADVVVSNFVPKGTVVANIKSREKEYSESTSDEPTIAADIPVVVLVNAGSASASEIVAGALQDHKRATIVGEKTFGKGTVQQIVQFVDQSSVKMTIAEWFTPSGRTIEKTGLVPDVVVEQVTDRDAQLLKALEFIR